MMRRLSRLLAVLLLGSAAGVTFASGPANAAACPAGSGITVVVGSSASCDADGGSPATSNFRDAGHTLTMVDRQPGFVCRVDGAPSSANCVDTSPEDAYWGLFWSDGTSGKWAYSTRGVGTLKVPTGGSVAFVFQNGGDLDYPGVAPAAAAPAAKPAATPTATKVTEPTKKPAAKATSKPVTQPSSRATTPGAKATTSASTPAPTSSASPTPSKATPSATASEPATELQTAAPPEETDQTESASEAVDSSNGSGSLGWVAAVLVVVLLAGMGGVLWRRKTGSAGGSS